MPNFMTRHWRQYRHRFVPWLAINWAQRTKRYADSEESDIVIDTKAIHQSLLHLCETVHKSQCTTPTHEASTNRRDEFSMDTFISDQQSYLQNLQYVHQHLGFSVERKVSQLVGGGTGVFVTKGTVPKHTLIGLYPGTIYLLHEPLFFQSIRNQFIFRCADGTHIDGNDRGISKFIFKSCVHRDRVFPYWTADGTWLSFWPLNPLAIGQYVNNQSPEYPANVTYQEFDIPEEFPLHLRRYLPYVKYGGPIDHFQLSTRSLRAVVLVSLRPIKTGEELFSTYFTVIGQSDRHTHVKETSLK